MRGEVFFNVKSQGWIVLWICNSHLKTHFITLKMKTVQPYFYFYPTCPCSTLKESSKATVTLETESSAITTASWLLSSIEDSTVLFNLLLTFLLFQMGLHFHEMYAHTRVCSFNLGSFTFYTVQCKHVFIQTSLQVLWWSPVASYSTCASDWVQLYPDNCMKMGDPCE